MDVQDWQAAAEILGVLLLFGNVLGGAFIYRMQASFVTRAEHSKMSDRMDAAEDKVDGIDKAMSRLVTTEEMGSIYNRLGNVENLTATMNGRLAGISELLGSTNHMLGLLVKNELEGSKRP